MTAISASATSDPSSPAKSRDPVALRFFVYWRIVFGLYFAWQALELWPHLDELFTRRGVVGNELYAFNKTFNQHVVVHIMWGLAIASGIAIAFNVWRRPLAFLGWLGTLIVLWQNAAVRGPEMPIVYLVLILFAVMPQNDPRWPSPEPTPNGEAPKAIYRDLTWVALGLLYGGAGFSKLTFADSAWVNGEAMYHILQSGFARVWYGDFFMHHFAFPLKLASWAGLLLELAFPFLALVKRARPLLFVASIVLNASVLVLVNVAEVSLGMLVIHGMLLDDQLLAQFRALAAHGKRLLTRTSVMA